MKKINGFLFILVAIIVTLIIVLVLRYILDTTGFLNQGYFRINDVVIKSTVSVYDEELKKIAEKGSLANINLKLSQHNNIYILVDKTEGVQTSEMYIDNIKITGPNKRGIVSIYQAENDSKYDFITGSPRINLNKIEQEGQYLIELILDNSDFTTDSKIKEGTNSVTYDGTILPVLGHSLDDVKFKISFNLNIVEATKKVNTCKFEFDLPNQKLIDEGIYINRDNLDKYIFTIR